jgi:hypothetical protein
MQKAFDSCLTLISWWLIYKKQKGKYFQPSKNYILRAERACVIKISEFIICSYNWKKDLFSSILGLKIGKSSIFLKP